MLWHNGSFNTNLIAKLGQFSIFFKKSERKEKGNQELFSLYLDSPHFHYNQTIWTYAFLEENNLIITKEVPVL